jgi:hypothetical protein
MSPYDQTTIALLLCFALGSLTAFTWFGGDR